MTKPAGRVPVCENEKNLLAGLSCSRVVARRSRPKAHLGKRRSMAATLVRGGLDVTCDMGVVGWLGTWLGGSERTSIGASGGTGSASAGSHRELLSRFG